MTVGSDATASDHRGTVLVEQRDRWAIVTHGCLGGLVAGLVLGVAAIVSTVALGDSATEPFRFVAAFAVGDEAFASDFSVGAALLLGTSIHFTLSALYGIVFLAVLALTFQLSARAWLLVIYGSLFAFLVWEINFLAAVPLFFPYLAGELDLGTQLWNGVVSYCLVYGPALGIYVALIRPGVVDSWRGRRAPAVTFTPPIKDEERI